MNTITVPVFDRHAKVSFAVGVHLAEPALTVERIQALAREIIGAADRITAAIGGHIPSSSHIVHEPEPVGR